MWYLLRGIQEYFYFLRSLLRELLHWPPWLLIFFDSNLMILWFLNPRSHSATLRKKWWGWQRGRMGRTHVYIMLKTVPTLGSSTKKFWIVLALLTNCFWENPMDIPSQGKYSQSIPTISLSLSGHLFILLVYFFNVHLILKTQRWQALARIYRDKGNFVNYCWEWKLPRSLWKTVWRFLQIKNRTTI